MGIQLGKDGSYKKEDVLRHTSPFVSCLLLPQVSLYVNFPDLLHLFSFHTSLLSGLPIVDIPCTTGVRSKIYQIFVYGTVLRDLLETEENGHKVLVDRILFNILVTCTSDMSFILPISSYVSF